MIGSVPAAFAGVLVRRALGDGAVVQARIKQVLGWGCCWRLLRSRPALAVVPVASGMKLLDVGNLQLGLLVLALVLLAVPLWGRSTPPCTRAGLAGAPVGRRMAVGAQLVGAPLGVGFLVGLAYFGLLRPRLVAAVLTGPAPAKPQVPSRLVQRAPAESNVLQM